MTLLGQFSESLLIVIFKVHRPETPPLFTNKALVPVESKCRLPEKSILNDGKRVVDTPRNREAQQIMTDIKSAANALPVILGLFNRYQSEAEAEGYKRLYLIWAW